MTRKIIRFALLSIAGMFSWAYAQAQPKRTSSDSLLFKLLHHEDPVLDQILESPSRFEFQLIYTKVKTSGGETILEEFSLNKDSFHFYPASLIKFPVAITALEFLYQMDSTGSLLTNNMKLNTCSCDKSTESYLRKSKKPTIVQILREMLIMSNNDAYNLFFDLVGIDRCNNRMREMGYDGIILKSRFVSGCSQAMNRNSGGIRFFNKADSMTHQVACDTSITAFSINEKYPTASGRFHYEGKRLVSGPRDYSGTNFVRLADAHNLMIELFCPGRNNVPAAAFRFDSTHRQVLKSALGDFPRELLNAQQDYSSLPDSYYKFFLDPKSMNTRNGKLRIYNKVGLASGYLSDVSHFVDEENGISFFLSAALFAKKDGIAGGGNNNYFDLGIPALRKIGQLIYKYELALKCIE